MTLIRPKALGFVLFSLGLALLGLATFPIISAQVKYYFSPESRLIDPTVPSGRRPFLIIYPQGMPTADLTQATNWFPASTPQKPSAAKSTSFALSIPDIGLNGIPVSVNSVDLKKGAVHFPGTAFPGESGNVVIFGHSSSPYLYREGNPLTIFNPLPEIKVGAQITVKYDSVTYKYLIKSKRQLTLVTCVPLGTYWRRFVATAELVN